MSEETEFTVTIEQGGKTYEGRRVVSVKGNEASQFVTSDDFQNSKTDPMTYKYPEEQLKMEHFGKLIFAELLQECGILR